MKDFIEKKIKEKSQQKFEAESRKAFDILQKNEFLLELFIKKSNSYGHTSIYSIIQDDKDKIKAYEDLKLKFEKKESDDFFEKISNIQEYMRD